MKPFKARLDRRECFVSFCYMVLMSGLFVILVEASPVPPSNQSAHVSDSLMALDRANLINYQSSPRLTLCHAAVVVVS